MPYPLVKPTDRHTKDVSAPIAEPAIAYRASMLDGKIFNVMSNTPSRPTNLHGRVLTKAESATGAVEVVNTRFSNAL